MHNKMRCIWIRTLVERVEGGVVGTAEEGIQSDNPSRERGVSGTTVSLEMDDDGEQICTCSKIRIRNI
jgi:hypothetical protein